MFKLSKNKEKFKVNEREYRLTKWSTITTAIEGKKLLMAVAPSFTAMADMKLGSPTTEESLNDIIEGGDIEFLLTGAITQLSTNFTDEHFESLTNKLLSSLEFHKREPSTFNEEGEETLGDWEDFTSIDDWSEHFDDYPEDFELTLVKSIKVNLYDFFMKQATVRSSIEKVLAVVKPLTSQLNENTKDVSTQK